MRPTALRLIFPAIVVAILAVDRLTKIWAQNSLMPTGAIELLPFFHLTYVENTGAAWGMFAGRSALLITVSVVRKAPDPTLAVSPGLDPQSFL